MIMDYLIKPLKGVGVIEFGMLPYQVRDLVKSEFKSFKRSPKANFPCDYFPTVGMFAYYKASGELEALEFALPSKPALDGVDLLRMGFGAAMNFLRTKDAALKIEIDGMTAYAIGVSLYAPMAKENPMGPCESVLVFEAGYYS
jgi:hypothetical protein